MRLWPIFVVLAGCNGSLPPVPKETLVPVPVPCLTTSQLPIKPKLATDAELAELDDYRLVLAIRADQLELRGFVALQEALITACVKH